MENIYWLINFEKIWRNQKVWRKICVKTRISTCSDFDDRNFVSFSFFGAFVTKMKKNFWHTIWKLNILLYSKSKELARLKYFFFENQPCPPFITNDHKNVLRSSKNNPCTLELLHCDCMNVAIHFAIGTLWLFVLCA